jgi:hypothetical protein
MAKKIGKVEISGISLKSAKPKKYVCDLLYDHVSQSFSRTSDRSTTVNSS